MTDKEGEAKPRAAAAPATATPTAWSSQRLELQTSYGQAMIHARGYSAPETKAAFARARELTPGIEDPVDRFSVLYGLWANAFVSGQLSPTREITDIMLREAAARPGTSEACTATRLNGNANWLGGNFGQSGAAIVPVLSEGTRNEQAAYCQKKDESDSKHRSHAEEVTGVSEVCHT